MYDEKVVSQVKFELQQIDKMLGSYQELLGRCKEQEPNLVELTAAASVLHSFYNGVENIFLVVAKKIDMHAPEGSRWHASLLEQMSQPKEGRASVISEALKTKLTPYLGFRHFYRHSYSFTLQWEELEKLVLPLDDVWLQFRKEMNRFIAESVAK